MVYVYGLPDYDEETKLYGVMFVDEKREFLGYYFQDIDYDKCVDCIEEFEACLVVY